jgi:hypothetical protein
MPNSQFPIPNSHPRKIFWFSLSLTFASIYSLLALQKAFRAEYIVQDDARQHVFWMQRFLDPELFPNDLIADYFQSVAPPGYSALYWGMAQMGIAPMLLHKLLPLILTLVTTVYCFGVCLQLLPVPLAGFISTLLLDQSLWFQDDIASATPRAFVYPLFLAFLYYRLRGSLVPCGIAIALLGLFYPQYLLLAVGVLLLQVLRWNKGRVYLSPERRDWLFCILGGGIALLVLLPYGLSTSEFDPVITGDRARELPEFWSGRSAFFHDNPLFFWLFGERSGIVPALLPPLIWMGLFFPLLLRYPQRFPLAAQVVRTGILWRIVLASVGLFFLAHALLFQLHLPSRYTEHSGRVVMALAGGIALTLILDALLRAWRERKQQWWRLGLIVAIAASLILYPSFVKKFPMTNYRIGGLSELYEFFQAQPKDILIASLASEVHNLPTFSQRSILVGDQYAIPYHWGYYQQFRDRTLDLIRAQYSPDRARVGEFIQKYGVDFWLLERTALQPDYIEANRWLRTLEPAAETLLEAVERGTHPALASVVEQCSVMEAANLVVLEAQCLMSASSPPPASEP